MLSLVMGRGMQDKAQDPVQGARCGLGLDWDTAEDPIVRYL